MCLTESIAGRVVPFQGHEEGSGGIIVVRGGRTPRPENETRGRRDPKNRPEQWKKGYAGNSQKAGCAVSASSQSRIEQEANGTAS